MAELMGRNEYARHRGCAPNAVSKAIDSGRIKAAVVYDSEGKFEGINWEAADALWAQNTDPGEAAKNGKFYVVPPAAQAPASTAATQAPCRTPASSPGLVASPPDSTNGVSPSSAAASLDESEPATQPAAAAAPGGDGDLDLGDLPASSQSDNDSYLKARAQKEWFAAKNAQLDYLKNIGRLVDASAVRRELADVLSQVKTSALRIPDRKAQILAAETDPARVNRILTDEIRSVFDECSRQFADDTAGGLEEPATACS
jgi:hypothetical protein